MEIDFSEMDEAQQNRWYINQAIRTVTEALESNDPTQYRTALVAVKDYLWYTEEVDEDLE